MPITPACPSPTRRSLLLAAASLPLVHACTALPAAARSHEIAEARLRQLEASLDGRLGVYALDTGSGARLGFRGDERFPMCSTFKAVLAGAILERSAREPDLLQRRIRYAAGELVSYSPITEGHVKDGMTVAGLCDAAVRYSDNSAANLLLDIVGGPASLTGFARTQGDERFRLDRWETALNTAEPGDPRDTTTPQAMVILLQRLCLGDGLPQAQRLQLQDWLRRNTTGATRIRGGVPAGWQVGDKTGTGPYGTANDVGLIWPPQRAPLVLAIYTTRRGQGAEPRNDILAAAARVVMEAL
ncbi:MAG: class A beta-lactamase [Noviherbaspirillum sp.]